MLARAVLQGFPVDDSGLPLSRWTILVPNRRSARALEQLFLQESGKRALILPRIKPIGDIDEDMLADSLPEEGVPDALGKTDHLHAVLDCVVRWARTNPDQELAKDVNASGAQAFALAQSLQDLINQFETEDAEAAKIKDVYHLDLAGHRQNILTLLSVVIEDVPQLLRKSGFMGGAARRNQMIRLEAQRIAARRLKGPVIAAGSTGTNPATRDLLKTIAHDPTGAVILPGLDLTLEDEGWNALTPEHPQFAMAVLLQHLGLKRGDVQVLGSPQGMRSWLVNEALRPAAVADRWVTTLAGRAGDVRQGIANVELVEAADRQQEAEVIALRLRQHVELSKGKAALITPDRDLATRVKAAARRWNMEIDDSAGEPLIHKGRAALLALMLRAIEDTFSATSLFALLHHKDCHFGKPQADHLRAVRHLEIAAYRGMPESEGLAALADRLMARQAQLPKDPFAHPLLKAMTAEDWSATITLALGLHSILSPLQDGLQHSLHDHVRRLLDALNALSPPDAATTPDDQAFLDVMTALQQGSKWHPVDTLSRAQHSILHALARETLRPPLREDAQLAIFGLAEARLVDVELAILGGLAESAWPEHPDSGPWLNRPMRDSVGLQQPERDIGLTAHDFTQAFGHAHVMLTWPKRMGGAPAIPSRWVQRLQAVMRTVGMEPKDELSQALPQLAARLDAPNIFKPVRRPQVRTPVDMRPTTFSVTRIEKLLRDSYWIYARNILKLEPLDEMGGDIDASLRGTLVHDALQHWTSEVPHVPAGERLQLLLSKGQEVFRPYLDMPEVARFWWPRFARMASEFIAKNDALTAETISILTELSGGHDFDVEGVPHRLTARADRVDVGRNGLVRIIDYKTGSLPSEKQVTSGFSPQLTLEAALVLRGGFKGLHAKGVEDVMYIGVGGGKSGVAFKGLAGNKTDVTVEAEKAFAGMVRLLAAFQLPSTVYIPVHNPAMSDDDSDYDHLSRRLEWQQAGQTP